MKLVFEVNLRSASCDVIDRMNASIAHTSLATLIEGIDNENLQL